VTIIDPMEPALGDVADEAVGGQRDEQLREPIPELEETFSLLARRSTLPRVHAFFSARAGTQLDWYSYMALCWIGAAGPIRLSALAEHFGVVPSTVCRHVQHLDRAGLIERETDAADRRAVLLTPSTHGWRVLGDLQRARRGVWAEALADWSDDDLGTLTGLLARLDADLAAWGRRIRGES
jgi:DNA-binding MarR family transcriptional regulator